MAFQEGTSNFTCGACGAEHIAEWYRLPCREEQKLHCKACKGILFNGKAVHEYTNVRLVHKA